jgi:hypothetical protein
MGMAMEMGRMERGFGDMLTMSRRCSNCSSSTWNNLGREIKLRAHPWLEVEEDLEVAISNCTGEVEGMGKVQLTVVQLRLFFQPGPSPPLLLLFSSLPPFFSSLSLLLLFFVG